MAVTPQSPPTPSLPFYRRSKSQISIFIGAFICMSLLFANNEKQRLECSLTKMDAEIRELRPIVARPNLREFPEVQAAINGLIAGKVTHTYETWQRWFPSEDKTYWLQHTFKPHGVYGFIQFSGYRLDAKSFAVVGLASAKHRDTRKLHGCYWTVDGITVQSQNITMKFQSPPTFSAPDDLQYEVAAVICEFETSTNSNGGWLDVQIDFETFVGYREDMGQEHILDPPADLKYNLAYCGPGWHDEMIVSQVQQWMEYHRVLYGVDHFYLYDAGAINDDMAAMLAPYKDADLVTITDIRESLVFSIKYWGQPLAIADCTYRARMTSKWVFMSDVDEYLHVYPSKSLPKLLEEYADMAWLTHGSFNWDIKVCNSSVAAGQFMVERTVLRDKEVWCRRPVEYKREVCTAFWGHRKYILNPRKVHIAETHEINGNETGVNLNALTEMVHHHFRGFGAGAYASFQCSKNLDSLPSEEKKQSVVSFDVAERAVLVRKCPLGSPKECADSVVTKIWSK